MEIRGWGCGGGERVGGKAGLFRFEGPLKDLGALVSVLEWVELHAQK